MSDLNLHATTIVCVHADRAPNAQWIERLADGLPAVAKVCLFGACATAPAPTAWQRMPNLVAGDAHAALIAAKATFPDSNLVLLQAGTELPKFWFQRLIRALDIPNVLTASPLDNSDASRAPLPQGVSSNAGVQTIDALCFKYGRHLTLDCTHVSPLLSAWNGVYLSSVALETLENGIPATLAPVRAVLLDHLYVMNPAQALRGPEPNRHGEDSLPPSPLGELRERIAAAILDEKNLATNPSMPGLDDKPVVLHILHGWGGGAERFVRDFAATDQERSHLVLMACGQFSTRHYGERLELLDGNFQKPPLRQLNLPRPIADTAISDSAYTAFLEDIRRDFCIDSIVVSSLIGHSLDALRTGLPTLIITHDYYPLWPVLHCDFGDLRLKFDAKELSAALTSAGNEFEFASHEPVYWQALREAYAVATLQARVTLVSPSNSALANLLRLEPRFTALQTMVIPHGLAPWEDTFAPSLPARPARARLRLAMAGRIRHGKGAQLLKATLPELRKHADLFLIGAGSEGEQFFGESNVHIIKNYTREELPNLIAQIAPDAALLLPTVSETFSYMLSELWSLGLPVLATRLGSLAERIEDGANGWLADPTPTAITAMVVRLAQSRDEITKVHRQVATQKPISLQTMLASYRTLLSTAAHSTASYPLHSPTLAQLELATLCAQYGDAQRALDRSNQQLAAQQYELDARANWASDLERNLKLVQKTLCNTQTELKELTEWGVRIQSELETQTQRSLTLQTEFEDRTRWALQLDKTATEQRDQLTALLNERSRIMASLSWRMTAPLRFISSRYPRIRTYLGFWFRRTFSVAKRVRSSLARRGAMATLKRIVQALRPADRIMAREPIAQVMAADEHSPFHLPTSATPHVSIVIPVYNKFAYTYTCLRSLAEHASSAAFEVIVVDDNSSDETPQRLQEIAGIRTTKNLHNLGFVDSCNAGAAMAKGQFILFLNNDTKVTDGWLDALLRCFSEEPQAGLVGAKLVYPDGRLQEAGGIIFDDGSGWNYGRFDNPADPRYNYRREVDYCSGAAIMIRRELFVQLGGFDARYAPAYYEDTDLAFAVRAAGLKVIYEPAATVIHFEGITSGTDTSSGVKRYQIVNKNKFFEKWETNLALQPKPHTAPELACNHRVRGRVLIVDAYTPTPDQDSGSLRMVNVMRVLRKLDYAVSFLPENCAYVPRYSTDLQALGIEALYHPFVHPVAWFQKYGANLNAVFLSRHYVASSFIGLARLHAPQAKLIFDTVDLHYLREQRAAELENRDDLKRIAAATRVAELKVMRECDITLVVSPAEQALLGHEQPQTRVEILSNVHEVYGRRQPYSARRNLVFVGGFQHPPNVDAVQFFVRDVFPIVRSALADIEFHVVGSKAPDEIHALAGDGVVVHGYVEDIVPFMDGCRLSIAPLRYGAGVKGKVNMAMSYGLPVVATACAVEGMHVRPGVDVMVADQPAEMAGQIVRVYNDEALWNALSTNGLENVGTHFSFTAAREALQRILN